MARIEKLLQQLLSEHQLGLRESSVTSVHSIKSAEEGDEEVWYQIGRELEDVGISPEAIREHRDYITDWIKNELINGRFREADTASNSGRSEYYESVTHGSIRKQYLEHGAARLSSNDAGEHDEHQTKIVDGGSVCPGDVSLSSTRTLHYICRHVSCQEPMRDTFVTWFELLMHIWEFHCKDRKAPDWDEHVVRDEEDNVLNVTSPDAFPSLHYDYRHELAYVFAVLQGACRSGFSSPVVLQLMYDLYYSRKCLFSQCNSTSKDPKDNRYIPSITKNRTSANLVFQEAFT